MPECHSRMLILPWVSQCAWLMLANGQMDKGRKGDKYSEVLRLEAINGLDLHCSPCCVETLSALPVGAMI